MLQQGVSFTYEYDFGSTTDLVIEVLGTYSCPKLKEIQLLVRNEAPVIFCDFAKRRQCIFVDVVVIHVVMIVYVKKERMSIFFH